MTCKDCLYCDVCKDRVTQFGYDFDENGQIPDEGCGVAHGFKNKADFIDNNKGYSPDNCRFVTPAENSRNRRNTKFLTIQGVTKCVSEWCREKNISQFTVYWWIREKGVKYAEQRLSEIA